MGTWKSLRWTSALLLAAALGTGRLARAGFSVRALRAGVRQTARNRPDLVRWYTFADLKQEGLAFDPGPQKGTLTKTDGRWQEQSAVHIFHGMLRGKPVNPSPKGFSVCFWLRVRGWEKVDRAGYKRNNGGVMAVGSGWYGGWRFVVVPASGTISFGLGRPDSLRKSVSAPGCLEPDRWHHVALTWDRKTLRLYTDGALQAEAEAVVPYTPPHKGPDRLRIGECGYGVGVLDFDIADLSFYSSALPADLIKRLGDPLADLVAELSGMLGRARGVRPPPAEAAEEEALRKRLSRLADLEGDPESRFAVGNLRCIARLDIGDSFRRVKRWDDARRAYGQVADNAAAPLHYRARAMLAQADLWRDQRRYTEARKGYAAVRDFFTGKHENFRLEAIERLEDVRGLRDGEPFRNARTRRVERLSRPVPGFYVAPGGNDANPGTRQRPFKTLERARDAVRALKAAGPLPPGGVAVVLAAGVYRRTASFILGPEDSGTPDALILYRAASGASVILRGGRRVDNFEKLTDPTGLKRIPKAAQPHVLQANLTALGIKDLGKFYPRGYGIKPDKPAHLELFFKERPMPLARWPNDAFQMSKRFTTVNALIGEKLGKFVNKTIDRTNGFVYGDPRHASWLDEPEIWLFGYWGRMYAADWVKVTSIDPRNRQVRIAPPLPPYAFIQGAPYFAANVLRELDAPGEWYLDQAAGMLFFWPPAPIRKGDVVVSLLNEPFLALNNVSHVAFRGLVFEAGRFHGAVISEGEDVTLAGCVFRNIGVYGVRIEGGRNHTVVGCDLEYLGDGAVYMRGGDVNTLTPSGHLLENCHIHHFDRWNRAGYQAGVSQVGVGTRISHCLIHDGPHQAVYVRENDHVLEYSEIHDTCYEAGEMGSYYMYGGSRVLGERGQVVRFNYWHHLPWNETFKRFAYTGRHALHIDHMNGDITLYGNIFQHCSSKSGVFFSGGPDNTVENNLFLDCALAINLGDRSWVYRKVNTPPRFRLDAYLRRMKVNEPPWSVRYPQLKEYPANARDLSVFLTGNVVARNAALECGSFLGGSRKTHALSRIEHNWRGPGAGFRGPARRDFRLRTDARVAVAAGFDPLPAEDIGLYKDALRATWPVRHPAGTHEDLLTNARPANKKMPVCRAFSRRAPINIDGRLTAEEWAGFDPTQALDLRRGPGDAPTKSLPSTAWVLRDRDFLYVALRNPVNPAVPLKKGDTWWAGDMAEVIFEGKTGVGTGGWWLDERPHGPIFYLVGDYLGNFDSISVAELPRARAVRLRAGVEYAARADKPGEWTCEWKIPIALLCLDPDKTAFCNFNIGVHKPGGNPTLRPPAKLTGNDLWAVWSGCSGPNWQVWNAGQLRLKPVRDAR
ncbi:MAG: hypothetical protein GXP31_10200 [Kiritimatiellaeota bacterium]|nr:hypothetical protein [Kiritimatiellota bacterium]